MKKVHQFVVHQVVVLYHAKLQKSKQIVSYNITTSNCFRMSALIRLTASNISRLTQFPKQKPGVSWVLTVHSAFPFMTLQIKGTSKSASVGCQVNCTAAFQNQTLSDVECRLTQNAGRSGSGVALRTLPDTCLKTLSASVFLALLTAMFLMQYYGKLWKSSRTYEFWARRTWKMRWSTVLPKG